MISVKSIDIIKKIYKENITDTIVRITANYNNTNEILHQVELTHSDFWATLNGLTECN